MTDPAKSVIERLREQLKEADNAEKVLRAMTRSHRPTEESLLRAIQRAEDAMRREGRALLSVAEAAERIGKDLQENGDNTVTDDDKAALLSALRSLHLPA